MPRSKKAESAKDIPEIVKHVQLGPDGSIPFLDEQISKSAASDARMIALGYYAALLRNRDESPSEGCAGKCSGEAVVWVMSDAGQDIDDLNDATKAALKKAANDIAALQEKKLRAKARANANKQCAAGGSNCYCAGDWTFIEGWRQTGLFGLGGSLYYVAGWQYSGTCKEGKLY